MDVNLNSYLVELLEAVVFLFLASWLGIRLIAQSRQRRFSSENKPLTHEVISRYLWKFGTSSNSVYHLYNSMDHLFFDVRQFDASAPEKALIGYTRRFGTALMLTDPLCALADRDEAIEKFAQYAKLTGDDAMLLAVDYHTAQNAEKHGFKTIKIGSEPLFDLTIYDPELLPAKLRSSIRQVEKKGVVIEEVTVAELFSHDVADTLNELLSKWFMTRGCEKMLMLTEVAPAKASENKKFFIARHGKTIEGFLACSSMYARNGYFLHDLIRAPFSINGVAEALIVHALKELKLQGYELASLGVSPLAGLDKNQYSGGLKWANNIICLLYTSPSPRD